MLWALSNLKNEKYLWWTHFYWMCDCKPVSKVLEYDGGIAMVSYLDQEILGYHFSVVHRPARMMIDIDSLP